MTDMSLSLHVMTYLHIYGTQVYLFREFCTGQARAWAVAMGFRMAGRCWIKVSIILVMLPIIASKCLLACDVSADFQLHVHHHLSIKVAHWREQLGGKR